MPKDTKTLCIKKGCASVLTQPLCYNIILISLYLSEWENQRQHQYHHNSHDNLQR